MLPAELAWLLVPALVYIPINIAVELSLIIWAIVATRPRTGKLKSSD